MISLLDLIGNTPIVEIKHLHSNINVRIFAKLEWLNPSGSIKDRTAKYMIEKAEERGELTRDKIILEATSGNMGIALATIGVIKKYKVLLTMSEAKSIERRKIIKMLGAELILTNAEDPKSHIKKADQLNNENPGKYYYINQHDNWDNCEIHYETTGKEILEQTNGKVDCFIAGLGTGGTLMGVSKRLKEYNQNIRIISVESANPQHIIERIMNLKSGLIPGIYDQNLIDETIYIGDVEAVQVARQLTQITGFFGGISSGATMAAAIRKSKEIQSGNIVVIFADAGLKYMSTRLFEGVRV